MTWLKSRVRQASILFSCLVLLLALWTSMPARAADSGDAMLVWAVQNSATSPWKKYTQSSSSWSTKTDQSTDSFGLNLIRVFASPTEDEIITIGSNTNGQFRAHRYSGSSWSLEWTEFGAGSSSSAQRPKFDGAYDVNGNFLLVYSRNSTTNEVAYIKFTASTNTWTSEQAIGADRTNGVLASVKVENRAGTDEFAVAWSDANGDLSANYYDFSADTWYGEPSAALSTDLSQVGTHSSGSNNYDMVFESVSQQLLICWGNNGTVGTLNCASRTAGTGGSWSTFTYTGTSYESTDMNMAADPNSDQISWIGCNDADDIEAAIWSGSAFGNYTAIDTTGDTLDVGSTHVATGWVHSGGTSVAVFTFDDVNDAGIDWATFNANTSTWTVPQSDYTGAFSPAGVNDLYHLIVPNPLDRSQLAVLIVDGNFDLALKELSFDGSSFTWSSLDDGSSSHETNVRNRGGWAASFAYFAYNPIPPVLSVDIVNSSGATVGSPSVSMTSVTSGTACQTSTGTLGTSSERVRVTNTTSTASWSLTIAATGGSTALWTSGSNTYDFNDNTSSGCGDGADADTKAGQLSITPSTGTGTPKSGCTNTGLTWGSGGSFVQGVFNSLSLVNASSSAGTNCYWDFMGMSLSQEIPELTPAGNYSLQFTLTVTAS